MGNIHILDLLINFNANVNSVDESGATPLMWALSSGNLQVIYRLLEVGAKVDMVDGVGVHTLQYALKIRNANLMSDLIQNVEVDDFLSDKILREVKVLDDNFLRVIVRAKV